MDQNNNNIEDELTPSQQTRMDKIYRYTFRTVGVFLMFLYMFLTGAFYYYFIFTQCYIVQQNNEKTLSIILMIIGSFFTGNIFFNYIGASFKCPGKVTEKIGNYQEQINIQLQELENKTQTLNNSYNDIELQQNQQQFDYSINFNKGTEDIQNQNQQNLSLNFLQSKEKNGDQQSQQQYNKQNQIIQIIKDNRCKKCELAKPLRAHHCITCNGCILRMDHHCPWINNCVGHFNQRYFLNLLLYTWLMVTLICSLQLFKLEQKQFNELTSELGATYYIGKTFSYVLYFPVMLFLMWSWFLALSGQTTIEFMVRSGAQEHEQLHMEVLFDFRNKKIVDNLFIIYGTRNLFMMLMPSLRDNKFNGIEWNNNLKRQKENNFNNGKKGFSQFLEEQI